MFIRHIAMSTMFHIDLFRETKRAWTPEYEEIWCAAARGKQNVTLTTPTAFDTLTKPQKDADYMKSLGLTETRVRTVAHKDGEYTYEAVGSFTPDGMNEEIATEWLCALGRRGMRLAAYGSAPMHIQRTAYELLDELHVLIQQTGNSGYSCVIINNPSKDKFDAPFPLEIAIVFRDLVKKFNLNCQLLLATKQCFMWSEECILLWNWSGDHSSLPPLKPYYSNFREIPQTK